MDAPYIDGLKDLAIAAISAVVTAVFIKIKNKTSNISYTWHSNRVAVSASDAIFGDVRVTLGGTQVRNLHIFVFDIENNNMCDFSDIELRVFTDGATIILGEKTEFVGLPYIVEWSDKFKKRMFVEDGGQPSSVQSTEHSTNREYFIPVLNRGQKLRLTYLCNRPSDDNLPQLSIATLSKGVRLKLVPYPSLTISPILGVPVHAAILRALLIAFAVVIICSFFIDSAAVAATLGVITGLVGQIFGAMMYRVEQFLRDLISK